MKVWKQKSWLFPSGHSLRAVIAGLTFSSLAFLCAGNWVALRVARAASQEQPAAAQESFAARDDTRPAAQVYKNIQILKTTPANEVVEIMKFFTRALGVRCEHCHVTAEGSKIPGFGAFSKDDLAPKQRARQMLEMVGVIGPRFFAAPKKGPTCWTCHRGSTKPEIDPPAPPEPTK